MIFFSPPFRQFSVSFRICSECKLKISNFVVCFFVARLLVHIVCGMIVPLSVPLLFFIHRKQNKKRMITEMDLFSVPSIHTSLLSVVSCILLSRAT